MNGAPLPRDHGYPVRALVPGHAGARNAKWLHKIIVSDKESDRPWQQKSYRAFAPDINFEKDLSHWPHGLRLDQAAIIQEMPVQSIVCTPRPNQVLAGKGKDELLLRGAQRAQRWGRTSHAMVRVQVSRGRVAGVASSVWTSRLTAARSGRPCVVRGRVVSEAERGWVQAELHEKPHKEIRNRRWGWQHWSKVVKMTPAMKEQLAAGKPLRLEVISKAMNGDFNVQPERVEPFWNARGVCINHWYRVPVVVDPKLEKDQPADLREFGNTPSGAAPRVWYVMCVVMTRRSRAGGQFLKPWGHHGFDHESAADVRQANKGQHFVSYEDWKKAGGVTNRER